MDARHPLYGHRGEERDHRGPVHVPDVHDHHSWPDAHSARAAAHKRGSKQVDPRLRLHAVPARLDREGGKADAPYLDGDGIVGEKRGNPLRGVAEGEGVRRTGDWDRSVIVARPRGAAPTTSALER
jgi:hypothetical protein